MMPEFDGIVTRLPTGPAPAAPSVAVPPAMTFNRGERIYRYEVPVNDRWHPLMIGGDPLFVACRVVDVVEFWSHWNPDEARTPSALVREFRVFGTGHPLDGDGLRYWGTALAGPLVWHLLERPL